MTESSRVHIASCRDDAEATLVRAVLTAHDIPVYIKGQHHAAAFGLGAAVISLDVWVARDDAEAAAALIHELREGGEAQLADDEIPIDDTAERSDETADGVLVTSGDDTLARVGRRKRIALALLIGVLVSHGTAHLSTRAWKRGIALAAIQIVGWFRLGAGDASLGTALVAGAIVVDVIGAIWEIGRTTSAVPTARALIRS